MSALPSPRRAERMQAAKRSYLPPIWPLLLGIALIIVIATLVTR